MKRKQAMKNRFLFPRAPVSHAAGALCALALAMSPVLSAAAHAQMPASGENSFVQETAPLNTRPGASRSPLNMRAAPAQDAQTGRSGQMQDEPPSGTGSGAELRQAQDEAARQRSRRLREDASQEFMQQRIADTDVQSIGSRVNVSEAAGVQEEDPLLQDAMEFMEAASDGGETADDAFDSVSMTGDARSQSTLPPDVDQVVSEALKGMNLKNRIPKMRYDTLRQAGLTLGMRAGLARQTEMNNRALQQRARMLDHQYNFQALMLQGGILPPVIAQSLDLFEQDDPSFIQLAGVNYRIVSQARFTYTPPSWRSYLLRKYPAGKAAAVTLKPDSKEERLLWENSVREGFRRGRLQAMHILREGWQMLARDFEGMARYRALLAQQVVSAPFVEMSGKDVVGDGQNMSVGVKQLRIVALPQLQTQRHQWRPDVGAQSPAGYLSGRGEGLGNETLPVRDIGEIELGRYARPGVEPAARPATPGNLLTGD